MRQRDKELIEACQNGTLYDYISNNGYQYSKEELIEIVKQLSFSIYERLCDQSVEVERLLPDNLKEYNFFEVDFTIEQGHTMEEYEAQFGTSNAMGDLWDFPKEDFESGAVEYQEGMTYWEIDGRLYETTL